MGTLGGEHRFIPSEIRFDHAFDRPAYDYGTRSFCESTVPKSAVVPERYSDEEYRPAA